MTKVNLNSAQALAAIQAALSRSPQVVDANKRVAKAIVDEARRRAPKRTGAGAKSIHYERVYDQDTRQVRYRVSWDRKHFYMGFIELGSQHNRAQPFLRPAADSVGGQRRAVGKRGLEDASE